MFSATHLITAGLILLVVLCVVVLFLIEPEPPVTARHAPKPDAGDERKTTQLPRVSDAEDERKTTQLPRVSDATSYIPVQHRKLPPVR